MANISSEIAEIQAASRGSEVRQPIVDALNKVNAGVLPAVSSSDAGKFLVVDNDGDWEVRSGGLIPTPTGTKTITQNGTHDVTNYASADVNVPNSYSASDEGKVVDNGALVSQTSKSVTRNGTYDTTTNDEVVVDVQGGGGIIEPLSVTQNGTYTPPSGVDGYAPVTVNVSGGMTPFISNANIITATDIITEFACAVSYEDLLDVTGLMPLSGKVQFQKANGYHTFTGSILYADLEDSNVSGTIYAVIRSTTAGGDYAGISFCYMPSHRNMPLIYTRNGSWMVGTYGNDNATQYNSMIFHVLALRVNNTNKKAAFFFDGVKHNNELDYSNSGRFGSFGGGVHYIPPQAALSNEFDILYGALVRGIETDSEIIANSQAIMSAYSSYIGT